EIARRIEEGLRLHRDGRLAQAQAVYRSVLEIDPEQPDALHLSGVADSQSGDPAQAIRKIEQAIRLRPDVASFHTNLGNAYRASGHVQEALASYARAIALDAGQTDALANRARVLSDLGRFEEAIDAFDQALTGSPGDAEFLNGKGNALQRAGQVEESLDCYEAALAANPRHRQAHVNRGRALMRLGRHEQAVDNYRAALQLEPQSARLRVKLGDALKALGRHEEAILNYDAAIACPDSGLGPRRVDAAAWNNRGNALRTLGRTEDAIESFGKALDIVPEHAEAWFNLGNALKAQHRYHDAIACYDRVLQLSPGHGVAANNRGVALGALGRIDASIESLDRAIANSPDNPEPPWNKSVALLLKGDFARGWPIYENRWTNDNTGMKLRQFPRPHWLGRESIAGRTMLLHAEQGFGDTIQFCRFASVVADRGARVVLEVPSPLLEITRSLAGVDRLIVRGEPLPEFDLHCPLLSLPLGLGLDIRDIPLREGYLRAPEDRRWKWRSDVGEGRAPRIGLVWSGNPAHGNDHNRSLSLARLLEWLPEGPDYYSLQRDGRVADRAALLMNPRIRHFGESLRDFADTAAVCEAMDLVISVDTSVAHLSAALGRPTWILLPFVPDWRWLLDREDSPWYASVRLFRQPRIDDWEGVLARLRDALAHWLAVNPRRESEPRTGRQRARSSGIGNLRHLEGGNRTEATTETAVGMLHGTSDDFDALHARAVTAAQHGDTTAALRDFDRALRLQPGNAEAWSNRGHALRTAGRLEEACGSYDRAIALRREVPGAWLGKALCLADLGGPEDSLACFDEAVRQAPDDPQAHFLRANVLRRLDRLEAALAAHDRALALRPGHAEGWDRRGLVLEALGRIDAAVESHDRALLIKPGDARAARNKGMALLVSGALAEGFRLYERRWDVEPMASAMPDFPWPRWRGEVPLAGRTLLLHSEQGLGDTLQFCRYAPLAAAAGATVLLEVPEPLTELMGTLEGVDRLVRRGDPLPACDLHSPLMSLPYAFRTTLGTIPARVPYLFADEARTEAWRARLGEARSLGRPGAPDRHALLPRPPEAGR
ncbi:MAG: hypothetical protein RIS35_3082, partial [Pseudomonadota bacterium]